MTQFRDTIRGGGGGGGGKGGGGGGSVRVPTESPDSLRSKQFARVLDLVSEGEIVGLIDGMKSIYLDDTPIQNADNSYNFQDVTLQTRVGTQSQTYIPGFPAVESETAVSVEALYATPVVRSISNANLTAVRITVSIPNLTYQNPSTGDLSGDSVGIAIDLQTAGGGYVEKVADTISGKTTTPYQRSYRIELPGSGPWDIRLRRTTADSVEANRINKVFWSSYTEIIDHLLRYPNSGLVGLQIDASQFRAIPRRGFHMRGIKVRVPSNYNPTTRVYTGNWDGTFQVAYTNNPAWCFYDLITSTRYGLGDYIDSAQVDKWALYSIGQYCDELVDDGFGGTEPRFTCNLYLQSADEAYNVLQNMASVFRAMVYESGGFVTAVQDAPADPVMLYTPANVIDGVFNYAGSSIKARHTVALVSWNDPADRYQQKVEYVEDVDGITRYGVRETLFVAMGCTSRGQAHRAGRWLLYTERMETETVTFRTGLDSSYVTPGEIIQIADPSVAGVRLGGRMVSATTTSVTVDAAVTITTGHTYSLSVILPDGSLATRALNNAAGNHTVLTFATALPSTPQDLAMWVLSDVGEIEPQTFRVLGVGQIDKATFEIFAVEHNSSKYTAVDTGVQLETPPISAVDYRVQQAVTSVTVVANTEQREDGTLRVTAVVSWPAAPNATRYQVELKRDNDNYTLVDAGTTALLAISEINQEGTYTARVIAFNAIGTGSAPTLSTPTQLYWVTLAPPANLALVSPWVGPDVAVKWDMVEGAMAYVVEIHESTTLRRSTTITEPQYTYTFDYNKSDGGPWRAIQFKVKSIGASSESDYSTLNVSNPQHNAPANLTLIGGITTLAATVTQSTDRDFSAYIFHASTVANFTPGPSNLVYEGPNNFVNLIDLTGGTTWYVRATAYDVFDKTGLSYTSQQSVVVGANAIITTNTLPGGTYLGADVVFYTGNAKLYRWNGSTYVTSVDAGDIAGQVQDAQLAAIAAGKVVGQIVGTQIVAGAITTNHISAGAVNTAALQAGAVTADKITVATLSALSGSLGTITAGNITLDTSGFIRAGQTAYDTGGGFWMGYSGGQYVFSLGNSAGNKITWNGTTLNITGNLVAATGTFSGTLSAASGTFSGTLTAANVVTTSNIQSNAVTMTVGSFAESGYVVTTTATDVEVLSASITTVSGRVLVVGAASFSVASDNYLIIKRGATTIYSGPTQNSAGAFTGTLFDEPGTGTFTYRLYVNLEGGVGNTIANRCLALLEARR